VSYRLLFANEVGGKRVGERGVLGAKNNLISRLKRNNEILTIGPESNLPSVLHKTFSVPARKAAQSQGL
jgi:hypothetical protein